jgi:FkbM family methyltransferase
MLRLMRRVDAIDSSYSLTTRHGFRFYCDPQFLIERHIASSGEWEATLRPIFEHFIRLGFVCCDVGANSGYHSLGMAKLVGPKGKVLAFEPSCRNLARLTKNMQLNVDLAACIELHPIGLSDSRKELSVFAVGQEGNAYVSKEVRTELADPADAPAPEPCVVERLDDVLQGRRVDFIKIDVEGMEYSVLRGASDTIARWRPVLVYETLLDCFDHGALKEVERWLLYRNYTLAFLEPQSGKLVPTRYPRYLEDTVAYPSERALDYAPFIVPAATYAVASADGAQVGHLLMCGGGYGRVHVRFSLPFLTDERVATFPEQQESAKYLFPGAPKAEVSFESPEQREGTLRIDDNMSFPLTQVAGRLPKQFLWL